MIISALEAKQIASKAKILYKIAENIIPKAAEQGEMMCDIDISEIPDVNAGALYEVSNLLNELGYQTLIAYPNTLTIYWHVKTPTYYNIDDDFDNIEE